MVDTMPLGILNDGKGPRNRDCFFVIDFVIATSSRYSDHCTFLDSGLDWIVIPWLRIFQESRATLPLLRKAVL